MHTRTHTIKYLIFIHRGEFSLRHNKRESIFEYEEQFFFEELKFPSNKRENQEHLDFVCTK